MWEINNRRKAEEYISDSLARKENPDEITDIPVIQEIRNKKDKMQFKFSMVSKVLILFMLGILVILRFARITEINYQTNEIIEEYEKIADENHNLSVKIEKEINLSDIRREVEEKLNLHAPNESQIVYINTSSSDSTHFKENSSEQEEGTVKGIIRWVKNFFGIA